MNGITADEAGFCFGVKRALGLIGDLPEDGPTVQIYGELIHNQTVLEQLRGRGIQTLNSLDEVQPGATVVIRTHGVTRLDEDRLAALGGRVLDTTCPLVKRIHTILAGLDDAEGPVLMVGDPLHPEVVAAVSHGSHVRVVSSPAEAETLPEAPSYRVVAQTTLNEDVFRAVVSALLFRTPHLVVYNTICSATRVRQAAVRRLADRVDFMVVVGGRNSSNTAKLYDISRELNPRTIWVTGLREMENGLPSGFEAPDDACFGVTGGASTPPDEIEAVKNYLECVHTPVKESKHG